MGNLIIMKKIYIVHGWSYTIEVWDTCLQALRDRGYEPVMFKVPGLTEPSLDVWDLDKYIAWLKSKLEQEGVFETKNVTLLVHSNGGRIAIGFANKYPDVISKLILLDAAGIVHNDFKTKLRRNVLGSIARIGKKILPLKIIRKIYYRLIGGYDYELAPPNMRKTMSNLITIDLTSWLQNIKAKTLILWGAHDKATPVSDAHVMHKNIKNSELYIFPDARHSPHITHPELVADKVHEWLSKNA
jgi:pimeloyl-ACP methyl ester carboxylesterase